MTDELSFPQFDVDLAALIEKSTKHHFGFANAWLRFGLLEVYIRIGKVPVGDDYPRCLTIANLTLESDFRRKGYFTAMLGRLRKQWAGPVRLENVFPEFAASLLGKGWEMERRNLYSINLVSRG